MTTLLLDAATARVCANIPITDNNVTEPPEEFCVVLFPEGADPNDPSHPKATITITDDDRVTIGFEMETYSAGENQGSVEVCAIIREGGLATQVIVSLLTQDITAVNPDDYTSLSAPLSFSEDTSRQCVDISLINDDILENIEEFEALLQAANSAPVILSPERAVVRITDDDGE